MTPSPWEWRVQAVLLPMCNWKFFLDVFRQKPFKEPDGNLVSFRFCFVKNFLPFVLPFLFYFFPFLFFFFFCLVRDGIHFIFAPWFSSFFQNPFEDYYYLIIIKKRRALLLPRPLPAHSINTTMSNQTVGRTFLADSGPRVTRNFSILKEDLDI